MYQESYFDDLFNYSQKADFCEWVIIQKCGKLSKVVKGLPHFWICLLTLSKSLFCELVKQYH
jgi:hypothetical protein